MVAMRPDTSRWRMSSAYDFVDDLTAEGLAWEFLRRNADYQHDFAAYQATADDAEASAAAFRQRWGLRFPGAAGSKCGGTGSLLVP